MTSATPPTPPTPPPAPGTPPPPPPPGGARPGSAPGAPGSPSAGAGAGAGAPVEGTTEVLPTVVSKVSAFAAKEIPGVVALGGSSASRALGAVRQSVTGSGDSGAGVRVEMEGVTARLGLDVEIEYGVGARELVRSLRRHVPSAVEEIAGVTVTALDIKITDVHLPGGDPAEG